MKNKRLSVLIKEHKNRFFYLILFCFYTKLIEQEVWNLSDKIYDKRTINPFNCHKRIQYNNTKFHALLKQQKSPILEIQETFCG